MLAFPANYQPGQIDWNEGCDCHIAHRLGADDLGFVEQVIQQVSQQHKIAAGEVSPQDPRKAAYLHKMWPVIEVSPHS